jgi:hypothetical protein
MKSSKLNLNSQKFTKKISVIFFILALKPYSLEKTLGLLQTKNLRIKPGMHAFSLLTWAL